MMGKSDLLVFQELNQSDNSDNIEISGRRIRRHPLKSYHRNFTASLNDVSKLYPPHHLRHNDVSAFADKRRRHSITQFEGIGNKTAFGRPLLVDKSVQVNPLSVRNLSPIQSQDDGHAPETNTSSQTSSRRGMKTVSWAEGERGTASNSRNPEHDSNNNVAAFSGEVRWTKDGKSGDSMNATVDQWRFPKERRKNTGSSGCDDQASFHPASRHAVIHHDTRRLAVLQRLKPLPLPLPDTSGVRAVITKGAGLKRSPQSAGYPFKIQTPVLHLDNADRPTQETNADKEDDKIQMFGEFGHKHSSLLLRHRFFSSQPKLDIDTCLDYSSSASPRHPYTHRPGFHGDHVSHPFDSVVGKILQRRPRCDHDHMYFSLVGREDEKGKGSMPPHTAGRGLRMYDLSWQFSRPCGLQSNDSEQELHSRVDSTSQSDGHNYPSLAKSIASTRDKAKGGSHRPLLASRSEPNIFQPACGQVGYSPYHDETGRTTMGGQGDIHKREKERPGDERSKKHADGVVMHPGSQTKEGVEEEGNLDPKTDNNNITNASVPDCVHRDANHPGQCRPHSSVDAHCKESESRQRHCSEMDKKDNELKATHVLNATVPVSSEIFHDSKAMSSDIDTSFKQNTHNSLGTEENSNGYQKGHQTKDQTGNMRMDRIPPDDVSKTPSGAAVRVSNENTLAGPHSVGRESRNDAEQSTTTNVLPHPSKPCPSPVQTNTRNDKPGTASIRSTHVEAVRGNNPTCPIPDSLQTRSTKEESSHKKQDWIIVRDYQSASLGGYGSKYNVWTKGSHSSDGPRHRPGLDEPRTQRGVVARTDVTFLAKGDNNDNNNGDNEEDDFSGGAVGTRGAKRGVGAYGTKVTLEGRQVTTSQREVANRLAWKLSQLAGIRTQRYHHHNQQQTTRDSTDAPGLGRAGKETPRQTLRPASRGNRLRHNGSGPGSCSGSDPRPRSRGSQLLKQQQLSRPAPHHHPSAIVPFRVRSADLRGLTPESPTTRIDIVRKCRPVSRESNSSSSHATGKAASGVNPLPGNAERNVRQTTTTTTTTTSKDRAAQFIDNVNRLQASQMAALGQKSSKDLDPQTQELLDYFWSYQGIGRQILNATNSGTSSPLQGAQLGNYQANERGDKNKGWSPLKHKPAPRGFVNGNDKENYATCDDVNNNNHHLQEQDVEFREKKKVLLVVKLPGTEIGAEE